MGKQRLAMVALTHFFRQPFHVAEIRIRHNLKAFHNPAQPGITADRFIFGLIPEHAYIPVDCVIPEQVLVNCRFVDVFIDTELFPPQPVCELRGRQFRQRTVGILRAAAQYQQRRKDGRNRLHRFHENHLLRLLYAFRAGSSRDLSYP